MDSFTRQYLATALWSSSDDQERPLDQNYSISDIAPDSLVKLEHDCSIFQAHAAELMLDENLLRAGDYHDTLGTFGHDFWLTRNHHGAGFWDGDYLEPAASKLTLLAHTFGECDLYVGDDGKIHV
jgi:hypothetical protein